MENNKTALSYTNLKQSPHLVDKTIRLIEESLDYKGDNHFDIDFYPLVKKDNHLHCHIIVGENEEVLAHIGVKEKLFKFDKSTVKAYFLGGIVVSTKARRQGLFKGLHSYVLEKYHDSAMIALWSDKSHLYNKFDYYECGGIYQFGKNQIITDYFFEIEKTNDNIKTMQQLYDENINAHYLSPVREKEDWEDLFKTTSISKYFIKSKEKIIGYFLCNKGEDLQGIIHELVLPLNDKQEVISFEDFQLWLPENNIFKLKSQLSLYTCFFKINDQERFKSFIEKYLDIKIISISKEVIDFTFSDENYSLSKRDFFQNIFGPSRAVEIKAPPLFIGGFDSV